MGKWLDAVAEELSPSAVSAISADRSFSDANSTNCTNCNEPVNITPLGQIVAKSKLPPANLVPEDWRDFFEERAAILEFDGGLSHEKADRLAYESCVVGLANTMPTKYPQDRCSACGTHLGPQQGLPLGDHAIVCDSACHTQHRCQQREQAEQQLAGWGIAAK